MAATSRVRVGVRVRPLAPKEASEGGRAVVDARALDRTVSLSKRKFTYDSVFHEDVAQTELYQDVAPSLLEAFLGGYNATVLAYGQTGSGKTFTMGSEARADSSWRGDGEDGAALDEGDGLIPRFMADIFANLSRRKEESERGALSSPKKGTSEAVASDALVEFSLSASFLEVYGEDIHDLLDDSRASLPIREGAGGEVMVKGLKNVPIQSDAAAIEVLNTGKLHRTTAATLMNCTSSRSHAVFAVSLKQTTRGADGVDVAATSRFTFVDLAGSERLKKTGAQGERAREGIKINEGLLALGNVINALADEEKLAKGEKVHVPYRESKLTRLLTDALGGNSQTLFIACVSPSDTNASETLSTLQYANRARQIRNAPTRNVDATALELQRLRAMTNLLKCELVKQRFAGIDANVKTSGDDNNAQLGVVDEELLKRDDVLAYMKQIDEKSAEMTGVASEISIPRPHSAPANAAGPRLSTTSGWRTDGDNRNSMQVGSAAARLSSAVAARAGPNAAADDKDQLVLDVNPEEDLQIIDQLLELRQHDQRFQKEQSDDQDRLEDVEGEIEAQEGRLLQLREHLKKYHSMKGDYEQLLCDVSGLESEKKALAEELERAQADPTRGCSRAIKGKLKKIEENLARARSDTRRLQKDYRQAEAEAQKGRALERKIQDLKHTKVALVRKQKEDATKHREFTNQKTREIQALKRREKNADRKMSKMETEVNKHRMGLERSRAQCTKLSDKLKQTESHLMKLLARRRNESKSVRQSTMHRRPAGQLQQQSTEGADQFAQASDEVKSIEFLLEKTVADRVAASRAREAYEARLMEHGRLMRALAKEAKSIHELRKEYQEAELDDSDEKVAQIREHEDAVEALQLKTELIESDLEQLQAKYPSVESEDEKEEDEPALKMLSKLDSPVLRTLLWNLVDSYCSTETQRRALKSALGRKDSTLRSVESEMALQSEQIEALTESLERYRKLAADDGPDPMEVIQGLEEEVRSSKGKLETCHSDNKRLQSELEGARDTISLCQRERAQAEEKLALFRSHQKLTESTAETERVLTQMQEIMAAIGMSQEERESVRNKLENCVEDACSRMLDEASSLRDEKTQQVDSKKDRLAEMRSALGLDQNTGDAHTLSQPLNAQLESIDRHVSELLPQYEGALERCRTLASDAEKLISSLHPIGVSDHLQQLMKHQRHGSKRKRASHIPEHHRASMEASREARAKLFKNAEAMINALPTIDEGSSLGTNDGSDGVAKSSRMGEAEGSASTEPGALSTAFLDSCEQEIKSLRVLKADRLHSNDDQCKQINAIAKQMHVTTGDLSSIVLHGMKKSRRGIPSWWSESVAGSVYSALSKKAGILVTGAFTDHLSLVFETLQKVSQGRQLLSGTLNDVLKESHSALLATAEGCGMDVNALSRNLHDALSHLPPLSKEYFKVSVEEMEMLATAAETVSQSEIETLTVLWEGLNVSSSARGRFWGACDQQTSRQEMETAGPFDRVLEEFPSEVEENVLKALKDATRVQRTLGIRVFKLKKVHEEVERLKRKQDRKNAILSLNNELKILDAQLAEFEEQAGSKQRLMSTKVNSSSRLEEERFRKQTQGTFSAKLNTLRKLLNDWEATEGAIDDADMLSDVVKSMLDNSDRIEAWMSEKTRLMHLRTTRNASSTIRPASKPRATEPMSGPGRGGRRAHHPSSTSTDMRQPAQRSARPARPTAPGHRSRPASPTPRPKPKGATGEHTKRKALSSSKQNSPPPEKATKRAPIAVQTNAPQVSCPFGDLLADTPTHKENNE
ncbi:hypothetical protein ACHAXT_002975 [Thalassiosira profunda]